MNKNLRKAMISAICMLIVGVMSLTGVTYAWFTSAQTATVNGVEVQIVSADGGIQLDNGDGEWTYTLDAVDTNANTTSKQPVSAVKTLNDDQLTFFTATVPDAEQPNMITTVKDEAGNYFVTDFRMRNANATTATVTLTGSVTSEKPIVRNAVRWAIVDKDKDVVYFFAGNTANDNIDGEQDYLAVKAAVADAFNCQTPGANVEWVALNELSDFTAVVAPVEYAEDGTVTNHNARSFALYAWLEGNDVDCTNTLSGSKFNVNLSFNTTLAE